MMIKFKEFDVGDIHYEEQIEKFQKEHQNAEFIQITGGYTSYEKIWFKYDDGIERDRDEFWYENEDNDRVHHLKILPEYFEAVVSGDKCFEIRKNDRGYKVGDILRLNEYEDGKYTGSFHVAEITYITDYAQQDGYVVLGIK